MVDERDQSEVDALAGELRRQLLTPTERLLVFLSFVGSAALWLLLMIPKMNDSMDDQFSHGPSGGTVAAVMASFLLIPVVPAVLMTVLANRRRRRD